MAVVSHWQLPVFRELRLEDSFVLGVRESENEVRFDMEFSLGERHPGYRKPAGGERDCFRKGRLIFREVSEVAWRDRRTEVEGTDDAPADLGKIDTFVLDGGAYKLRGQWGKLDLRAGSVHVDVW